MIGSGDTSTDGGGGEVKFSSGLEELN